MREGGLQLVVSLNAFEHILLEDTFVFEWNRGKDSLTFKVLASLLSSHPDASPPASGEWACYRSGTISFVGVTLVHGLLPRDSVRPTVDPDGSIDYGCIDQISLERPGEYRIAGEFGSVSVTASDVSLAFGDGV